MYSRQKKGINFDLDTEALKEHDTKGDWRNAYHDIRNGNSSKEWVNNGT